MSSEELELRARKLARKAELARKKYLIFLFI